MLKTKAVDADIKIDTLSDPRHWEEPSLPDFSQIWAGIKSRRFLLIALLVSAGLHLALLGVVAHRLEPAAPPRQTLTIRFENTPGSPTSNGQMAVNDSSGFALPEQRGAPIPVVKVRHYQSREQQASAPAQNVTPAPPPTMSWWQYSSEDMGYYGPEELDKLAVPANGAGFLQPVLELTPDQPGRVWARIYINERGGVDRVEITASEPPGVFDQAVLLELYRSSFIPAIKNGLTVKSQKDIEIHFDVLLNQRLLNQPGAMPGAFNPD